MLSTKFAVTALAATAIGVCGCGKSSSTPSTSQGPAGGQPGEAAASTVSRKLTGESAAEAKSRAERICLRLRERRNSNRAESTQEAAEVAAELAKFEQKIAAELGNLRSPVSSESNWAQIVTGAQALAADTAKISEYVKSDELSSSAAKAILVSRKGTETRILTLARHDGFRECGKSL
ncbi:MAG TPA: hypothetical protein VFW38_11475 [Solirubrobacteraceae bacterium]|nr:hypothetical protein [Solirubrobacteraceae bacterium]